MEAEAAAEAEAEEEALYQAELGGQRQVRPVWAQRPPLVLKQQPALAPMNPVIRASHSLKLAARFPPMQHGSITPVPGPAFTDLQQASPAAAATAGAASRAPSPAPRATLTGMAAAGACRRGWSAAEREGWCAQVACVHSDGCFWYDKGTSVAVRRRRVIDSMQTRMRYKVTTELTADFPLTSLPGGAAGGNPFSRKPVGEMPENSPGTGNAAAAHAAAAAKRKAPAGNPFARKSKAAKA